MRCFLTLRPGNRLVAGEPLLLVHIRLDQARINRERFATNKPSRNACRHHTLKHPAQGVALTKAMVEIKRVKELPLSTLSPPHHRPLPRITSQSDGITVRPWSQREFCNTFPLKADKARTCWHVRFVPIADKRTAAKKLLFDHLVGAGEQRRGHVKTKCLRAFQI